MLPSVDEHWRGRSPVRIDAEPLRSPEGTVRAVVASLTEVVSASA